MFNYCTLYHINAVNTASFAILSPVNCHPSQDRIFGTANDTKISKRINKWINNNKKCFNTPKRSQTALIVFFSLSGQINSKSVYLKPKSKATISFCNLSEDVRMDLEEAARVSIDSDCSPPSAAPKPCRLLINHIALYWDSSRHTLG